MRLFSIVSVKVDKFDDDKVKVEKGKDVGVKDVKKKRRESGGEKGGKKKVRRE